MCLHVIVWICRKVLNDTTQPVHANHQYLRGKKRLGTLKKEKIDKKEEAKKELINALAKLNEEDDESE